MIGKIGKNYFSITLHAGFWLLYIILFTALLSNFMSFNFALLRISLNGFLFAFAFYFNALILVNSLLENKKYVSFFFGAFFLIFITGIFRYILLKIFTDTSLNIVMPQKAGRLLFVALLTMFIVILISTFYQLLQNRIRKEKINREIINRQNEAQLQFLKAQINPHFLFNTLNNIYALAVTKSEKTPEMILKLSEMLRYVIYDSREKKVQLTKEIEHISKFIELFQMKSETPQNITFQEEGKSGGLLIEPMILIPFVENCFKHTDFETNENAFIKIILAVGNKSVKFITLNSKDESDRQKDKTGGVGLENIRRRLELNYKNKYDLSIQNKKQIFEVNLSMELDE